jgi:hypothetical protein
MVIVATRPETGTPTREPPTRVFLQMVDSIVMDD